MTWSSVAIAEPPLERWAPEQRDGRKFVCLHLS